MTTVGCDAGLTSTTFHGSPLNPLLCGSSICESAQSKFIRLVCRKQTITFILTFMLSFGAHVLPRIYMQQWVRVPSECNQLTQDHARVQISALSEPGSRWCCNNTDKPEHGIAKKWEEEMRETETRVQTGRMRCYPYGFMMVLGRRHRLTAKVFLPLGGAWGRSHVWENKKEYKNCFYKYPQAGLKFIVQDAKRMLQGTEKSAVLGKLFVSWLAVTLHAAWWIGTGKEKARYSERYTEANNIYMQHVWRVMEYWISV